MIIYPTQGSAYTVPSVLVSSIVPVDSSLEASSNISETGVTVPAHQWLPEYVVTWEMVKDSPLDRSGWPMDM